jgi:hypothetical protein
MTALRKRIVYLRIYNCTDCPSARKRFGKRKGRRIHSSDLRQDRGGQYGTLFATFSCHHRQKCSVFATVARGGLARQVVAVINLVRRRPATHSAARYITLKPFELRQNFAKVCNHSKVVE